MPQVTRCPHCNQSLQLPGGSAGKSIRCPVCKQLFSLAAAPSPAPVMVAAHSLGAPAAVKKPTNGKSLSPPRPSKASRLQSECPACKAKLRQGATACMECGYLLQAGNSTIADADDQALCPNPACGVANPAGERICQRCASPLPWPAGTVLHDRYRIDKLLAIGGFAVVYLATDLQQGNREVALKDMICPEPGEFQIRLNFFQREAEILRALERIPIVPRFYQFIHRGQSVQLVLELIRGQDLLKLLEANDNRPFPLNKVIEWGKGICEVLDHMHRLNPPLVHRDVKPDNVMLLDDQTSIRMIDFGTARDTGRSQRTRLASKTRVYTEGYAPPEQIVGKPEARSDLFALAGTLYHLATGRAPEGHYTARELEEQLADPGSSIPAGERWLFELIKINLAEDVHDRYFSCREFKADLEHRRVTREMVCTECRSVNPVRQPFCQKCAAPLTESMPPCSQCQKTNRMGCRYCIQCGNLLR
jgi:hypothetical protein